MIANSNLNQIWSGQGKMTDRSNGPKQNTDETLLANGGTSSADNEIYETKQI